MDSFKLANLLYASHTLVELGLGLVKLRGYYAHEDPLTRPLSSQLYVRHHAAALLSLSLLGGLVLHRGLVNEETGWIASVVLAVFHIGAVIANVWAWILGAATMTKIVMPHLPFALGFLWHLAMFEIRKRCLDLFFRRSRVSTAS
eukprot:TRINITY_DN32458_c0_g1_i2.p1 TRINITY_DN32458_c0_g1~~TRINITY_DN32458_c0_g1_i2.p1  ORF type:complete len:145 (-),score=11.89 TRINITY_DN32458_c0_g1_i2:92-526(-)